LNILWIDDDVERMQSLYEMMTYEDHVVTKAATAGDALEIIKDEDRDGEFDVVLLDMMMPPDNALGAVDTDGGRTTGLALLTRIRQRYPDMPVVVCSVVKEPEIKKEALRLGAKAWVQKPALPSQILRAVEQACSPGTKSAGSV